MSRSTVKRGIADLIRCGLLTKEPRYRENGSNSSNRYFLKK
jgi:predicted transcriptional regulator